MRRYLLIYFDFCIWELCNLDSLCLSLIALQNAFDEVTFFEVACSFFFVASKPCLIVWFKGFTSFMVIERFHALSLFVF